MKKSIRPDDTRDTRPANTKQPYGMPTPEQIATLAAQLAKRQDSASLAESAADRAEHQVLAHYAVNLWQAAENAHHLMSTIYRSPLEKAEWLATPHDYPKTLKDFLIDVLPFDRTEDRKRAWKHYNLTLAKIDPKTATPAQEKEAAEKWESPQTIGKFAMDRLSFLTWWTPYHAAEVSKTKRDARNNVLNAKKDGGEKKTVKKRKARPPREKLKEIAESLLSPS